MNREERKQLWNEAVDYLGITDIYVCNDTDLFGGVKSGESEVTMVVPVLTQEIRQKKIEFFKEHKRHFYFDEDEIADMPWFVIEGKADFSDWVNFNDKQVYKNGEWF